MLVFPERAIPVYATPVSETELVVGETYFQAAFVDEAKLVPELRPLVFLGSDLPDYGMSKYAFQDASSYLAGISPDERSVEDPVDVHLFERGGLGGVYTFELALEVLLRCSLKRKAGGR